MALQFRVGVKAAINRDPEACSCGGHAPKPKDPTDILTGAEKLSAFRQAMSYTEAPPDLGEAIRAARRQ